MNYLIHGALEDTNFGDCLFAHIFYNYLKENNSVSFSQIPKYGISEYLKKELELSKDSLFKEKDADALVYMSGGYFGDYKGTLKESLKRYLRYFIVAIPYMLKKKPIYICGVGGGPINNGFLLRSIVRIMNYSTMITVRDQETADYFTKAGVRRMIEVTTDTALTLGKYHEMFECNQRIDELLSKARNDKLIFLHVYGNSSVDEHIRIKIVPALNRFLSEHSGYTVVVGTDSVVNESVENIEVYKSITGSKIAVDYYATKQMCYLLSLIDCAITTKLHVGIVSSVFNKSVLSFPNHIHKTRRFYKQIGEENRCVLLNECTEDLVYEMICKYVNKPINIENSILDKAWRNLEIIK